MNLLTLLTLLLAALAHHPAALEEHATDPACLLDVARVSEAGCCFDGRDNDNDGLTDHQDPDCQGRP